MRSKNANQELQIIVYKKFAYMLDTFKSLILVKYHWFTSMGIRDKKVMVGSGASTSVGQYNEHKMVGIINVAHEHSP